MHKNAPETLNSIGGVLFNENLFVSSIEASEKISCMSMREAAGKFRRAIGQTDNDLGLKAFNKILREYRVPLWVPLDSSDPCYTLDTNNSVRLQKSDWTLVFTSQVSRSRHVEPPLTDGDEVLLREEEITPPYVLVSNKRTYKTANGRTKRFDHAFWNRLRIELVFILRRDMYPLIERLRNPRASRHDPNAGLRSKIIQKAQALRRKVLNRQVDDESLVACFTRNSWPKCAPLAKWLYVNPELIEIQKWNVKEITIRSWLRRHFRKT